MNSEQVGGIIRALISAIGGYFMGKGYIDSATLTMIAGALATLGASIWSIFTNKPGTNIAPSS